MGKHSIIFKRRLVCYFQVVIQDLNCVINMVKSELDFIFTTIDKLHVFLKLILISFVGMDVSAKGSLMWEEAIVPKEKPQVQDGNHHTNEKQVQCPL